MHYELALLVVCVAAVSVVALAVFVILRFRPAEVGLRARVLRVLSVELHMRGRT